MNGRTMEEAAAERDGSPERFLLALKELLAEKNYSEISVTELCRKSGLSRNTFYKFFVNKDAMMDYLWEWLMLDYPEQRERLVGDVSDEYAAFYLHYFRYWDSMRDWVKILVDNGSWRPELFFSRWSAGLLTPPDWSEIVAHGEDAEWLAVNCVNAGLAQMVREWCWNGFRQSPEEMAGIAVYVFTGQLLAQAKPLR